MYEKSILVYYLNYDRMTVKETCDAIHSIQGYLEKQFYKDINDTLEIIIVQALLVDFVQELLLSLMYR